ncbi:MAG: ABC transporter permease [Candidatus Bathyarchaeota archaeon]|nr:ABC transporter permease [Candidatus Bathyarchaeota archaeon]
MHNGKYKSFSSARVMAVAWRVLKQISRDKRTLGMMIAMPALIMLIFGFVLGGEATNVPILVDNQDSGFSSGELSFHFGDNITSSLMTDDRVKVTLGSFEQNKAGVDNGTYCGAIRIPENFSQALLIAMATQGLQHIGISDLPPDIANFLSQNNTSVDTTISLYIDGTEPANQASIMGALHSALQNSSGSGDDITLDKQFAFGGEEYSGLDVSIPSVIAFILTFLVMLISLIIITREATSGTLQRIYTTPLSAIERLLGFSIALLLISILMVSVILVIGVGVFGAVVQGNIFLLFFGAVLYALAHVFLAVFLSNFAKNELQAVQMAPLIALPSMALSGMLIPVNSFPDWVQIIAKFVPMYYGNKLFEGIMLKGYGIGDLGLEFLVIGGIAVLFFALAAATVKDRITD